MALILELALASLMLDSRRGLWDPQHVSVLGAKQISNPDFAQFRFWRRLETERAAG